MLTKNAPRITSTGAAPPKPVICTAKSMSTHDGDSGGKKKIEKKLTRSTRERLDRKASVTSDALLCVDETPDETDSKSPLDEDRGEDMSGGFIAGPV